ncbi:MAG TPA: anaerobic sulfatase maturase [Desulfomonilia bacterium]|nr:anaerobic sulfatase maturase [Desulfomonilia bacterium]
MNADQINHVPIPRGLHVVAKPMGPVCNLACDYCFYLEKKALFGEGENYRMSDEVLRAFVEDYVSSQPTPVVEFVWQGGEPTLAGLDFFRMVVREQKRYAKEKTIRNSLQTNGTLLTDEWCAWLKNNNFMVGISLDGPREIHDAYRRNRAGKGTYDEVMRGLKLLQKHKVDYNVLACVARDTAEKPREVYSFLKHEGVEFIQFTPVVERLPDQASLVSGLKLAGPARLDGGEQQTQVTPWTVVPGEYGDFLIAVYEDWVRHDVGNMFVMNFEWALNAWIGNPSPVCIHAEQCGRAVAIEHNGDVYACDHCVYPEYKLGNIVDDTLADMVEKSLQTGFGSIKETALPSWCRDCPVLKACRGGCPKHRFTISPAGEPGLHYLCEGYKKFFLHIRKYLKAITTLLENGLPASKVMDAVKGPLVIRMGE